MALYWIEGLMRSGKSYMATEVCLLALKEGAIVHTNLPLVHDEVVSRGFEHQVIYMKGPPVSWVKMETKMIDGYEEEFFTSPIFKMGHEKTPNLVVVDEAGLKWPSDSQAANKAKEAAFKGLIALSGHAGLDIYILSQTFSQVSKGFRDLAQSRTLCSNCANAPGIGWLKKRIHGDWQRDTFDASKPPQLINRQYGKWKKEVQSFYRTHGMRDNLGMQESAAREAKSDPLAKTVALKLGFMALGILLLFIGGIYAAFGTWKTSFKMDDKPASKSSEPAALTKEKTQVNRDTGKLEEKRVQVVQEMPRGGLTSFNPEAYDEHLIAMVYNKPGSQIVYTRTGYKLGVGLPYEGVMILSQLCWAGRYYFICEDSRVVVARPIRTYERDALPPVTLLNPPQKIQTGHPQSVSSFPQAPEAITDPTSLITDSL